ncbi:hypothetical protein F4821DRAFT_233178 [Hypoxylon rubiginosum]|uniref:Uncharacterized protein n=1 Tax=Hypoxylon rubiginosum TaxID=110542 RepID=A0ACC0D8L4_9PEZI|nr:hypothetical protein F4821DRAFT_233178 [Hypoxylon rubiginosum]
MHFQQAAPEVLESACQLQPLNAGTFQVRKSFYFKLAMLLLILAIITLGEAETTRGSPLAICVSICSIAVCLIWRRSTTSTYIVL